MWYHQGTQGSPSSLAGTLIRLARINEQMASATRTADPTNLKGSIGRFFAKMSSRIDKVFHRSSRVADNSAKTSSIPDVTGEQSKKSQYSGVGHLPNHSLPAAISTAASQTATLSGVDSNLPTSSLVRCGSSFVPTVSEESQSFALEQRTVLPVKQRLSPGVKDAAIGPGFMAFIGNDRIAEGVVEQSTFDGAHKLDFKGGLNAVNATEVAMKHLEIQAEMQRQQMANDHALRMRELELKTQLEMMILGANSVEDPASALQ
ncbi:hypothetical protein D9619_010874 [Psilocybe cf. subviscida]|uniref:Uncharacterized protein n=1 Tax=Psilocybe cf. subviscida TaxID=2480587 RepID=A0A8H5B8I9_9AGAR|nr:hypothetical protein D9619_010874 [Psilocybe cf. subviscida]